MCTNKFRYCSFPPFFPAVATPVPPAHPSTLVSLAFICSVNAFMDRFSSMLLTKAFAALIKQPKNNLLQRQKSGELSTGEERANKMKDERMITMAEKPNSFTKWLTQ